MGFVVLFAIDSVTALVLLGFFFWGLTDRSVSSFNSALARPDRSARSYPGRQLHLKGAGRPRMANGLLALLAWPGCLTGFFFLVLILVPARWN